MKKIIALAITVLMCGCMPQSAETGLSGCSMLGLQALDFYRGEPAQGRKIKPVVSDGTKTWSFGDGEIYVVCGYLDEEEIIQILPPTVTSCAAAFKGADKTVSDLSCKAHI